MFLMRVFLSFFISFYLSLKCWILFECCLFVPLGFQLCTTGGRFLELKKIVRKPIVTISNYLYFFTFNIVILMYCYVTA